MKTPPAPTPLAISATGSVATVKGPLVVVKLPGVSLGDGVRIYRPEPLSSIPGTVVGFDGIFPLIAPLDHLNGVRPGLPVSSECAPLSISIGQRRDRLLSGSVVDATGQKLSFCAESSVDREPELSESPSKNIPYQRPPANPLTRRPISEALQTGVKAIDLFTPVGLGQRLGICAPAGVGKTTLIAQIARQAQVDTVVIGLIGERGREVQQFLTELGPEGRTRAVTVVATSDEAPLRRISAALLATSIAEQAREQGKNVLLLVDSLTRVARAWREVYLAAGELPVRQGYPPSLFTELPKLVERTGNNEIGSITALYTVLANPEGESDPLVEEVKSLLDGHIVLSKKLGDSGIRPAIDVLQSCSRLANSLMTEPQKLATRSVIRALARLRDDRHLVVFGGTPDASLKAALTEEGNIHTLLSQLPSEVVSAADSLGQLYTLAARL